MDKNNSKNGIFRTIFMSSVGTTVAVCIAAILFVLWSYTTFGNIRNSLLRFNGLKLIVEQERINLGTVLSGENKTGTFRLINLANNPITVLGVSSDCGCIKVPDVPITIFGKTTAGLDVFFMADEVDSETKIVRKMILNIDIEQPIQLLTVEAMVIPNTQQGEKNDSQLLH